MPWQDKLLLAIMDAEPERIGAVCEQYGDSVAEAKLECRRIRGATTFLLAEELYSRETVVRAAFGSDFRFERESARSLIASWLEMIGARQGDTVLHLVLRLNGIDDEHKAKCAVELLGRGASWEAANADNVLPSMVDGPAFKAAFLKELPAWREARRQQRLKGKRDTAEKLRQQVSVAKREHEAAEQQRQRQLWIKLREQAAEETSAARERHAFHQRLHGALAKLERRERKAEHSNPAVAELLSDIRELPQRFERWANDQLSGLLARRV